MTLLADLCQRGQAPAGAFALSPFTDALMLGGRLAETARSGCLLPAKRMVDLLALVQGTFAVKDPRLSPLYAAFPNPPPVLIQCSTTEILRDDSRRMVTHLQAQGGDATLSEWEDMPHVWQMFDGYTPQARAALREVANFIKCLI